MPYKDPEKRRAHKRQQMRQARAARRGATGEGGPRRGPLVAPVPLQFKIERAAQILEILGEEIGFVRGSGEGTQAERSRCVGYLCTVALRAIETGGLEARLDKLEAELRALAGPAAVERGGAAA